MKHGHYFRDVSHLDKIDVYRVIDLWEVNDPCMQHILKKVLCPGKRGHKDLRRDIEDIYDTIKRRIEMDEEDDRAAKAVQPAKPAYPYLQEVADHMNTQAALAKAQEEG